MMQKNAPDFSLADKVTFVTACAAAGSDIVLGVRDVAASAGLVAELERAGRRVLPVELDIPNKAHIARAVEAALATFARIDVLVNNVGVARRRTLTKYSTLTSRALF